MSRKTWTPIDTLSVPQPQTVFYTDFADGSISELLWRFLGGTGAAGAIDATVAEYGGSSLLSTCGSIAGNGNAFGRSETGLFTGVVGAEIGVRPQVDNQQVEIDASVVWPGQTSIGFGGVQITFNGASSVLGYRNSGGTYTTFATVYNIFQALTPTFFNKAKLVMDYSVVGAATYVGFYLDQVFYDLGTIAGQVAADSDNGVPRVYAAIAHNAVVAGNKKINFGHLAITINEP